MAEINEKEIYAELKRVVAEKLGGEFEKGYIEALWFVINKIGDK